jgi:hypothetical protein
MHPPGKRPGFSIFGKIGFLLSVGSSICIPWIVGMIVRISLDAQGKPTHDWSGFTTASALLFEPIASAVFSIPALLFGILILLATRQPPMRKPAFEDRKAMALGGLVLGAVGIVWNSYLFFFEFDPIGFLLPAYWLFYPPGIVVGWIVGWIRRRIVRVKETTL